MKIEMNKNETSYFIDYRFEKKILKEWKHWIQK